MAMAESNEVLKELIDFLEKNTALPTLHQLTRAQWAERYWVKGKETCQDMSAHMRNCLFWTQQFPAPPIICTTCQMRMVFKKLH